MSQQDVVAQLNYDIANDVEDIEWPFENIAVFSLGEKARSRARATHKPKHQVFSNPSTANLFDDVQNSNLFETVEWDAFVSLASPEL